MASNIQGSYDKVISSYLNRNTTSQKGMISNIPSNEKQRPTTKTNLPSKALIYSARQNNEFPREKKAKRIYRHQTKIERDAKSTTLRRWRKGGGT